MRALDVRANDHWDAIRFNHSEKSAIAAEHVLKRNSSHDIDWTSLKVIDIASEKTERKVEKHLPLTREDQR